MEGHRSIIIAVFSTSSGCGKTVTAINLAAGLADEGYRTCLVDLDLQFGDVMGYLDMVSDITLADAQRAIMADEENFNINDFLTEYKCGDLSFAVLPPPREINDAYQVNITNSPGVELPNTGGRGTLPLRIAGLALMLMGAAYVSYDFKTRRRRERRLKK